MTHALALERARCKDDKTKTATTAVHRLNVSFCLLEIAHALRSRSHQQIDIELMQNVILLTSSLRFYNDDGSAYGWFIVLTAQLTAQRTMKQPNIR